MRARTGFVRSTLIQPGTDGAFVGLRLDGQAGDDTRRDEGIAEVGEAATEAVRIAERTRRGIVHVGDQT